MSSQQDKNGNVLIITQQDIFTPGKPVGLTNPGSRQQEIRQSEWAASVVKSFAQLNPLPPYYKQPFPITYFNIFRTSL